MRFGCDAGEIAGHVARLAAKLAAFSLAGLVAAAADGRYMLVVGSLPAFQSGLLPRRH